MIRSLTMIALLLFFSEAIAIEIIEKSDAEDSTRIAELNLLYDEISRTVREGDFQGYAATYHEDAVVVYTTARKKGSIPIAKALKNWKIDFTDTKAGKTSNDVEFRFSQRVGDETTAFDTGIFHFTSERKDGKASTDSYMNFEMLMVKKKGEWLILMEYQQSFATEEDWISMQ